MCRRAMSSDFFDRVLPNPELSGDEDDLPARLLDKLCWSSRLGGGNFLIFMTLSTIFEPITTGLGLLLPFECARVVE